MAEPLKGKKKVSPIGCFGFFKEENIKSAVEWLKEKIKQHGTFFNSKMEQEILEKDIDEAFEDVTLTEVTR